MVTPGNALWVKGSEGSTSSGWRVSETLVRGLVRLWREGCSVYFGDMGHKTTFGHTGNPTNNVDRLVGAARCRLGGGAVVVAAPVIGRTQSSYGICDPQDDVAAPPHARTIDKVLATAPDNDEPKIPQESTTPPTFPSSRLDTIQRHTHLQPVASCIQAATGGGGWC